MKRPRWLPDTCPSTFSPPLFPFFSTWPPGNSHGYVSPRRDTTRHDTTAEALKPANLFLLSFHATRPPHSRTPLHSARSAPLDNVADKVARNVVAGNFFSPFPWRTNKTVRVVARVKRHEIRWPSFFTNHCSLLHEFIRYLSRYLTIYICTVMYQLFVWKRKWRNLLHAPHTGK